MSEEVAKDKSWRQEALAFWPLAFAVLATGLFALYAYDLSHELTIQDGVRASRYDHFLHGRPNEMGDTFAGFVGSLTLIWVVISVVQQSIELRAQRKEFSEMALAQHKQAKQLEKQVEILDFQLTSLKQSEVRRHLDQIIGKIIRDLKDLGGLAHWEVHGKEISSDGSGKRSVTPIVTKCGLLSIDAQNTEDQVGQAILGVRHFITRVSVTKDIMPRHGKKSAAQPIVERLIQEVDSALGLKTSLSATDSQWLMGLELGSLRGALVTLFEMDLWDPSGHDGYVVQAQ